jgi:hypothetical protein
MQRDGRKVKGIFVTIQEKRLLLLAIFAKIVAFEK